ncbi:mycofactocin biosynthesis glycosyltransferase MftF [Microtetraspora malaysiensis]|uniref:mycofactocin biosynthesis glycosyltransferase MftF n=1 Tax=Microtetraspora malaysiensis TaxID=161358 RepID=UPI00082EE2AE|nr:mycofactocin biosynthesis glycosyltransferase MftF [Microtetraspora malaysiensis]
MSDRLPDGFVVELGREVRAYDGGRTLVGGAPPRLIHLTGRAATILSGRRIRVADPWSERLAARLLALGMADPVARELPPVELSEVTVVVPVRDRPAELDRLLAGLGGRVAVIVVDDRSDDAAAVAEVAGRHGAELVALPRNVGPAGARNAGLARVRTPYVAFVDSDVVVDPDAVATLLRHFHHPGVAAVAPRVLGLDASAGRRQNWISRYEAVRSSLDLGPVPGTVRPRSPVGWVPSACLVARVAALGDGYADGMRVAEDVDLVWRLAAAAWQVRYEPAVAVRHDHRTGFRSWLGRKAFYGTGAHTLARRHGVAVAPAALAPWSVAAVGALLAQRRWSAPAAAVVLAGVSVRLTRTVSRSDSPRRLAAVLTGLGLAGALGQTSALLLRHWWPLSLAGCLVSRRVRRAVLVAALADGIVEYRKTRPRLDPVRFVVARRLDDLAYGAGVWAGAVRGRSARSLLPDVRGASGRSVSGPASGRSG